MSLRFRIVLAIVLVLLAGSGVGLALAGWQARLALDEELQAALKGGRQTVASAFADLPKSRRPSRDLERLIRSFDGDRHLSGALLDPSGQIVLRSRPLPRSPAPDWFTRIMTPRLSSTGWPIPHGHGSVLRLAPFAADDIAALWTEFIELALVLCGSIAATALMAWLTVGHALKPLDEATAAFERIGTGRYDTRLNSRGALELRGLAEGVNNMTERLAVMQARNQALERQLLTLQDEERADLARDLHDEMGPHLFAAGVDATMAKALIEDGKSAEAVERLTAIQEAVAGMKRMVRDILGRLRPADLIDLGLGSAISELVAFWRGRHPEIQIKVRTPPDDTVIAAPIREAVYRFVQEGLNNAIRHGRPDRIEVDIRMAADGAVTARVTDDGARALAPGPEGFGLRGMRERLAAIGGRLEIRRGGPRGGWSLVAHAPGSRSAADLMAAAE